MTTVIFIKEFSGHFKAKVHVHKTFQRIFNFRTKLFYFPGKMGIFFKSQIVWISWVIPNPQVIQGSYKDAHWYSEPKARKNILASKYLKWKQRNNWKRKIFQQIQYLPFRRTGFQPQTQDSLRVCWVWTSFHNFIH